MHKRSNEEKSRILADAETLGDDAAAAKHGVSTRQLRRYRKDAETCPEVAAAVHEKRIQLSAGWLEDAKKARMEALGLGLNLARKSENLRDVTGFLKIVHDAVLADEMLNGSDGQLDRSGNGVGSTQEPGREVPGRTPAFTH
jgi:transposase-like protein